MVKCSGSGDVILPHCLCENKLGPAVRRAGPESLRKVNNWQDSPQKCRNFRAPQSHSVTHRQHSGLHTHARKTRKLTETQTQPGRPGARSVISQLFCAIHMASTCSLFASKSFYYPSDPPAVLSLRPVTKGLRGCNSPSSTGNQWKKHRNTEATYCLCGNVARCIQITDVKVKIKKLQFSFWISNCGSARCCFWCHFKTEFLMAGTLFEALGSK